MPTSANGLHYEWFGDEGLPPVILSSGLGGLAAYWEPNIGALADDYRVLVYDHRDTGASERPADPTTSIASMAADVVALLDELALDEPPAFIGHAFGGLIGLEVAMTAPGRLLRLMVVNGWARLDPHTARCFDVRQTLLEVGPAPFVKAQPLFLYPTAYTSEHDAALLAAEAAQVEHFPGRATMEARIHAARTFDPGAYRLGTIALPVMCLAAEDDALVPAAASERLAGLIPGATRASMSWGGHAVNVTRPDEFVMRVKDWVR